MRREELCVVYFVLYCLVMFGLMCGSIVVFDVLNTEIDRLYEEYNTGLEIGESVDGMPVGISDDENNVSVSHELDGNVAGSVDDQYPWIKEITAGIVGSCIFAIGSFAMGKFKKRSIRKEFDL